MVVYIFEWRGGGLSELSFRAIELKKNFRANHHSDIFLRSGFTQIPKLPRPFCFYIIYSVCIHTYEFYTDYTYAYICTYQMHFLFCLLIWLRHVFVIYRIASHLKEVLEKYDFFLPVNKVVNPLDVELLRAVLRTIKCKKNVPRFATSHDLMCLIWFFSYAAFSHRSIGCTRLKNAQSNSWNHVARNWE